MAETFLNNVNKEKVESIIDSTNSNAEYFQDTTTKVVIAYSGELDNLMKGIYKDIVQADQPPLIILEKYYLELSNCLYFMSEKLEKLGVYDAVSKNAYKEVYNKAYLQLTDVGDTKKKPTVAELTALSENEALYENVVSDIYSKAYKIVKGKVDAANTMLNCISKIISKRIKEMQLTSVTPTGKQILNEDINSTGRPYTISPSSFSSITEEF